MSIGNSGCLARGSRLITCQLICVCSVLAAHERLIAQEQPVSQAESGSLAEQSSAVEGSAEQLTPEQISQISKLQSIPWQTGPVTGQIGNMARIQVPEGYQFVGAEGAQTLLEAYGNPRDPGVLAAIVSNDDELGWTLVFQFDAIGYVKDEDRDSIDADAILAGFNAGLATQNAHRRSVGAAEIQSISWAERPFYDQQTKNLTWALLAKFASEASINYDIRILGRHGVMEATILGDPETYQQVVPKVRDLLTGYSFTSGNAYAEWKPGDHIAQLGLAGLIGGGAAVAAAKSGLFGKIGLLLAKGGKGIVVGLLVIGAAVWSFIKRLAFGREESPTRQV